jgi:3-keto-5-aminohexanoate cleavage enzyme
MKTQERRAAMTDSTYMWDFKDEREYLQRLRKGMPPMIISVAITGGVHGKEANENLPEQPEEQAEQTRQAYEAGASVVHVHARNPEAGYAEPSTNPEHFYEINKRIREACPEIIINNTTGGGLGLASEERVRSLDAKPEMASLNCGPLPLKMTYKARKPPLSGRDEDVPRDTLIPITFGETEQFAAAMKQRGIRPELEVYHPGQYWLVDNLIDQQLIDPPHFVQFVMGFQHGIYPTPKNLVAMIDGLPKDSLFEVIGIGWAQLSMNVMGILLGGHIRTGMEDNVYYRRGEKCKNNAQLVERVVRIAEELGRPIATPKEARRVLGVSETPSEYP